MIFSGREIVAELETLGITHVIWVPDSVMGQWEPSLESSAQLELLRVCREGEAWPLAAGLMISGVRPILMMQSTGLFESGDALRNVVYDLKLPTFAIIGARNYLNEDSKDSAKVFCESILNAWTLDYVLIDTADNKGRLAEHYKSCQSKRCAGIALLAE